MRSNIRTFIISKKGIVARLFLLAALFIFFIPLFILPFFNHASADDYICGLHLHEKGFWDYQLYIYQNWGGRFSATFFGSLFAINDFLYSHYYVHTIILLFLNLFSSFLLIKTFNTFFLKSDYFRKNVLLFTLILMALQIACIPEASTYIFWFSSSTTYQLPIIFIQLEIIFFIFYYCSSTKIVKRFAVFLLPVLVFTVNGFNELFIFTQAFFLISIFYFKLYKKTSKIFLTVIIITFVSSAVIELSSHGSVNRESLVIPKNFLTGVSSLFFECFQVVWFIFKTPLFWATTVGLFFWGNNYSGQINKNIFSKKFFTSLAFLIFSFLFGAIVLAVAFLKGGIIAARYLNPLSCLIILSMLFYAFIFGMKFKKIYLPEIVFNNCQVLFYLGLTITIICNTFVAKEYTSIAAAPIYSSMMNERENVLKSASQNKTIPVVKTYDDMLNAYRAQNTNAHSKTYTDLIFQKPLLIFFQDDISSPYATNILKQFYGVDSIIIKK